MGEVRKMLRATTLSSWLAARGGASSQHAFIRSNMRSTPVSEGVRTAPCGGAVSEGVRTESSCGGAGSQGVVAFEGVRTNSSALALVVQWPAGSR